MTSIEAEVIFESDTATTRIAATRGTRGRRQHPLAQIRSPLSIKWRVGLGVVGVLSLFVIWVVASGTTNLVPSPAETWSAFIRLWRDGVFIDDLRSSSQRIAIGYGISVALGIVFGIAMGTFASAEAFFEPQFGFLRYIPASALTPVMLLWLGIGESPKITMIVIGTVFFNILMVADVARLVPRELLNASYTLGASRWTVLRRVVFRHSLPGIVDVARVNLAAAWLVLVVSEVLAANSGLAYRIVRAQRFRGFDTMFAVLIVFGLIGLISDLFLRWLRNAVAPLGQAMITQATNTQAMKTTPKLIVDGVSKSFGRGDKQVKALDNVDLHVGRGELVCLLGTSGCGKSTLLSIIGGLEQPTSGEIRVDDDRVIGPGADRGMVFQAYSLFPWATVYRNIEFGLELAKMPKAQRAARVKELLGIMSLGEFADRLPRELSGGMRQRVAIARALAPEPDVLLLDEPFGSLDAQTKRVMQDFLLTVWQRTGATILMVTHDVDEAIYLSQRIYVLTPRPGRVTEVIDVPFGRSRGPSIKRDPRFLDLRDNLADLLIA